MSSIVIEGKKLELVPMQSDWNHGLDEKTLAELKALPLEEQIARYRISELSYFEEYSYGKQDSQRSYEKTCSVADCYETLGVVVENQVVVGVYIKAWYQHPSPLFVGQCVCVYSVCDEDGTGRDEREDYVLLHLT